MDVEPSVHSSELLVSFDGLLHRPLTFSFSPIYVFLREEPHGSNYSTTSEWDAFKRSVLDGPIPGNRLAPPQSGPYQGYIRVGNSLRRLSLLIARQCTSTHLTLYPACSPIVFLSFISGMSQPSSSTSFQGLFNAALENYENETGTKLVEHPFAKQLETCNSAESITIVLQEQAQKFCEFRGNDGKITKFLKSSVDVLYPLFNSPIIVKVIGLIVHTNH